MNSILDRIRVVLMRTSHPGNIGSTCRAMKTMGLSRLYLVNPETSITEESYALSAGATDVLAKTQICTSMGDALKGADLIIGASARRRTVERPLLEPKDMAKLAIDHAKDGSEIALVFGCERTGLTNEELEVCGYHVTISSNPEYSSLNLAMAVQVLSYEVRMAYLAINGPEPINKAPEHTSKRFLEKETMADGAEVEGFYTQLEDVLHHSGFLRAEGNGIVMSKIKRVFTRSYLTRDDINILRGILSSVTKAMK